MLPDTAIPTSFGNSYFLTVGKLLFQIHTIYWVKRKESIEYVLPDKLTKVTRECIDIWSSRDKNLLKDFDWPNYLLEGLNKMAEEDEELKVRWRWFSGNIYRNVYFLHDWHCGYLHIFLGGLFGHAVFRIWCCFSVNNSLEMNTESTLLCLFFF